jgi:hypothetical protein
MHDSSFEPRHGEARQASTSSESQPQQGGRRLESQPNRTSQRYDLTHFHPGQARTVYPKSQSGGYTRAGANRR